MEMERVIIICTRNDLSILPATLFPEPITKEHNRQITAKDAIYDLENVECGKTAKYKDVDESEIVKLFKGKLSYKAYIDSIKTSHGCKDDT